MDEYQNVYRALHSTETALVNVMDEYQSAYRVLHCTETALINVMDDFLNFKIVKLSYTNTTT